MARYMMKIKGHTIDYAQIPKGMPMKQVKQKMHPKFRHGYTYVKTPTYISTAKILRSKK